MCKFYSFLSFLKIENSIQKFLCFAVFLFSFFPMLVSANQELTEVVTENQNPSQSSDSLSTENNSQKTVFFIGKGASITSLEPISPNTKIVFEKGIKTTSEKKKTIAKKSITTKEVVKQIATKQYKKVVNPIQYLLPKSSSEIALSQRGLTTGVVSPTTYEIFQPSYLNFNLLQLQAFQPIIISYESAMLSIITNDALSVRPPPFFI